MTDKSKEEILQAKITALQAKFVLKCDGRIEELNEALSSTDWEALNELGHKIKGTSACLDLNDFSAIGKSIQDAAEEKNSEKTKKLVEEFQACSNSWLERNPTS